MHEQNTNEKPRKIKERVSKKEIEIVQNNKIHNFYYCVLTIDGFPKITN